MKQKRRQLATQKQAQEAKVDTPGGRIQVQWDHEASATPNAQLTFFAEFGGHRCLRKMGQHLHLELHQPNAPTKKDVLGTWLLGILAGHNRYAHITA